MTVKEYLQRLYKIDFAISVRMEQLERLRAIAMRVTPTLTEDKIQTLTNENRMESALIRILSFEEDVIDMIDDYIKVQAETAQLIAKLEDENYRRVLELRYVNFNSWSMIAMKLDLEESYVIKLHRSAMYAIDKIYRREQCED